MNQAEEARKILNAYQELINFEGWQLLVEEMFTMAQTQDTMRNTPLSEPMDLFIQEFVKGTANGMRAAMLQPVSRIEECKAVLEAIENSTDKNEEKSDGSNTRNSDRTDSERDLSDGSGDLGGSSSP